MTTEAPERRLLAIVGHETRIDIAAPVHQTLGQALASVDLHLEPERHALVNRTGSEVSVDTRVLDLDNGAMLTIVDLTVSSADPAKLRKRTAVERHDHHSRWWLLGTIGVVLGAGGLFVLASSDVALSPRDRILIAAMLALAAVASTVAWARRTPGENWEGAVAMLAPVTLAFAAGTYAMPSVAAAPQLAVTVGLLCAATLSAVAGATARGREVRAVAGTMGTVIITLATIWGAALMFGWPLAAAAAVCVGIAAPGLRVIPTTLMNLPEGYFIDYKHFMSSRWTVRGSIPEDPGTITMDAIRPYVSESSAKLATGTVLMCALPPLFAPFMLAGLFSDSSLVRIGTVGTVIATLLVLTLQPRHGSSGPLRWIPRAAAAVLMLEVAIVNAGHAEFADTALATGLLIAAGIGSLALVVPLGKGVRSLVWSRTGDIIESIAVVVVLPLSLLAANAPEALREMMAG